MTWHHVAALMIAALMVLACGLSSTCNAASFTAVVQLATVIVAGAFGHAGAGQRQRRSSDQGDLPGPHDSGKIKP